MTTEHKLTKAFADGESSSHWYGDGGDTIIPRYDADLRTARKEKLAPSVTTIEKDVRANPGLLIWIKGQVLKAALENPIQPMEAVDDWAKRCASASDQKRNDAATFGSRTHDAMELYPTQGLNVEPDLLPFMEINGPWFDSHIQTIYHAEIPVLDRNLWVAGKLDLSCEFKGSGMAIVDYKTQGVKDGKKPQFYESWARQLAEYAHIYHTTQMGGVGPFPACISVVLNSTTPTEPAFKVWEPDFIQESLIAFRLQSWLWFQQKKYWPIGKWSPFFPFN